MNEGRKVIQWQKLDKKTLLHEVMHPGPITYNPTIKEAWDKIFEEDKFPDKQTRYAMTALERRRNDFDATGRVRR